MEFSGLVIIDSCGVLKVHTTLSWSLSSEYSELWRGTFHLQRNLKGYPSTGSISGCKISIPLLYIHNNKLSTKVVSWMLYRKPTNDIYREWVASLDELRRRVGWVKLSLAQVFSTQMPRYNSDFESLKKIVFPISRRRWSKFIIICF